MRKIIFTSLLSLTTSFLFAQDLMSKIPAKANAIATINTGKLLQLMTIEEWNSSNFGKKLLEMSAKDTEKGLKSINDIGISFSGNIYYFHTENDSMHYNYVLGPLADAAKFSNIFKDKPLLQLPDNTSMVAEEDSSGFIMWNKQQFLYTRGSLKDSYFREYEVALRHGLSLPYHRDTMAVADTAYPRAVPDEPVVDTVATIIEAPVIEEVKPEPVKPKSKSTKKPATTKKKNTKSKKEKAPKAKQVEEEKVEDTNEMQEDYDTYVKVDTTVTEYPIYGFDTDYLIKKSITTACTQAAIKDLFTKNPDTSVLVNTGYMKSIDANAAASIWIDKPMELYYNLLTGYYMYGRGFGNNFFNRMNNSAYKNFTGKLFFDQKQVRLTTAAEVTDDMLAMQQKMFDRKLNKKIVKYINTDSLLGYLSWSMDTKAYLENFPKMLENTYGNMGLGMTSDEYSVLSELVSFLIDEEAISRLVKGDGIVLFTGLYQQENTYTDYVYDDNFNSTPVEKTKTDTLPRFLMMFSSEENSLERKLINYGIKKEVVKQREGFFELSIPKSPMTFFFTNKDGIFFLTNSIADIQNISTGKFIAKLSKQEKKLLLTHNYSLYINPEKISGQIASTDIGAAESLSSAMNAFGKMGTIRAVMHPLQGNVISGEMTMDVKADSRNSLKYLFEIFDSLAK